MPITSSARVPMLACARAVRAFPLFGFDSIFSVRLSHFLALNCTRAGTFPFFRVSKSLTISILLVCCFCPLRATRFRNLSSAHLPSQPLPDVLCKPTRVRDLFARISALGQSVRCVCGFFESALHVNVASFKCCCSRDSDT